MSDKYTQIKMVNTYAQMLSYVEDILKTLFIKCSVNSKCQFKVCHWGLIYYRKF